MPTYEEYEQAALPTGMILTRGSWDKMTDTGRQKLLDTVSGLVRPQLTYDELAARLTTLEAQLKEARQELADQERAALQWAKEVQAVRWIPAAERLPEIVASHGHSNAVQVWLGDHAANHTAFYSPSGWYRWGQAGQIRNVSHWRELDCNTPTSESAAPLPLQGEAGAGPLTASKLAAFGYEETQPAATAWPGEWTRKEKLSRVSDQTLFDFAADCQPGSDEHYDAIMEICSRGLKDPEAGETACNFLPELKANMQARPRLGPTKRPPTPPLEGKAAAEQKGGQGE